MQHAMPHLLEILVGGMFIKKESLNSLFYLHLKGNSKYVKKNKRCFITFCLHYNTIFFY